MLRGLDMFKFDQSLDLKHPSIVDLQNSCNGISIYYRKATGSKGTQTTTKKFFEDKRKICLRIIYLHWNNLLALLALE